MSCCLKAGLCLSYEGVTEWIGETAPPTPRAFLLQQYPCYYNKETKILTGSGAWEKKVKFPNANLALCLHSLECFLLNETSQKMDTTISVFLEKQS